jgi:O-antigen/teichoic acid export membrane protein
MMLKKYQNYISHSALAQSINKCIIFINSIFVIYLSAQHLSKEEIGIYLSITSLVGIFFIFDLGIGGSITNRILHAKNNNKKMIPLLIASSTMQTIVITGLIFTLLNQFDFLELFQFSSEHIKEETLRSVKVFVLIFGFILIANTLERIFLATSKAIYFYWYSNIIQIISTFLIFIFLRNKSDISTILLISVGIPYALISLLSIHFFKGSNLSYSSVFNEIRREFKLLNKFSPKFFIISLGILLSFGLDVYLIGYVKGFSSASEYSIIQRLFQILVIPMMIINGPLISIFHKLYQNKNFTKLKQLLKFIILIILITSIIVFSFIYKYGNILSTLWTSEKISLDHTLITAFGIKVIIEVLMYSLINYFNAINLIQKQFIFSIFIVSISMPIKFFLINHYSISAMLFTYTFLYVLIYFLVFGFKIYPAKN